MAHLDFAWDHETPRNTTFDLWGSHPAGVKALFYLLLGMLIALALTAGPAQGMSLDLNYSAAFVPPHNEPVVGNKVARYRIEMAPEIRFQYLQVSPTLTLWGVNTWVPRDQQLSNRWRDDDWSVEEVRPTFNLGIGLGPERLQLFSEYFAPLGNWSQRGAGSFSSYWWLVGVRGEVRLF